MINILKPLVIVFVLFSALFAKESSPWVPDYFEAKFVKVSEDFFSKKVVKDKGSLYYKYPKSLRLDLLGKDKITYVSNPREVYYYRGPTIEGTPGELTISKSRSTDVGQLFDVLRKHGVQSNKNYRVEKKKNSVDIVFSKEMLNKLKIEKAKLSFSKESYKFKDVNKIIVTLDSGSHLHYENFNIKMNKKPKKDLFVFKAPKKTKISRQD